MASITFQQSNGTEVRVELVAATISFGKDEENDIVLEDAAISSRHGQFSFKDEAFYITDLESTNGTLVNGKEISSHRLQSGDQIEIGTLEGVFSDGEAKPKKNPSDKPEKKSSKPEKKSSKVRATSRAEPSSKKPQPDTPAGSKKAPKLGPGKPGHKPRLPQKKHPKSDLAKLPPEKKPYQQQEGIGFHLFLLQFFIIVVAIAGLSARHYMETGGFFLADAFNEIRYIEKQGPVYDADGNPVESAPDDESEQ